MDAIFIQETCVDRTQNLRTYDSDIYEAFTTDKVQLFRSLQREHGRCTGYIYIDTKTGRQKIGWVFEKRVKYDDCNEYYIQETWITLYQRAPEAHPPYLALN